MNVLDIFINKENTIENLKLNTKPIMYAIHHGNVVLFIDALKFITALLLWKLETLSYYHKLFFCLPHFYMGYNINEVL